MRTILGAIVGIITMISVAHPAKADFTICNDTTAGSLSVASAYDYDDGQDFWNRSEGFWTISQGQCTATLTGVRLGKFESEPYLERGVGLCRELNVLLCRWAVVCVCLQGRRRGAYVHNRCAATISLRRRCGQ